MKDKSQPLVFLEGDAPTPYMVIHNFTNIWKVVRANRRGDAKLLRTISNLERRTHIVVTGKVSTQAITPALNGFGFPTFELSGKGLYQFMNLWAQAHGKTNPNPSRMFTERMGLRQAEDWMLGTLAYLARDHSQVFSGTVPDDNVGNYHRYAARREWEINRAFWTNAFRPIAA